MSMIPPPAQRSGEGRAYTVQRTGTIFHQNEDFVYPIRGSIPGRIDEMDDIWMAFQDTLWTIS